MPHKDRTSLIEILRVVVGRLLLFLLTITGVAVAQSPVPLLNQPLVPAAVAPGGSGFTLTVNGSGFVSGSIVHWNGIALATTFISKSRLKAAVLSSDIAKPGTASVTVVNPGPGDGTSNVVFFEVTPPTPTIALAATIGTGTYPGIYPSSVAVGDFNRDGTLDLAVANIVSNNISVLLGKGDGAFQAAVNYDTGSGPTSVAAGDFNGDGKLDVVTANYYSNDVSVLLGNGDGTFQGHADYSGILHPESLAVGDFNGDGRLDVAVPFTVPIDQVGILLQAPTVTISTATLGFADQVIGTRSAQQVVTLSNTSVLSLRIGSMAVTGTNTSDFSETNTCGSGLPPGGECGITVTFAPTKLGPRMASVTITDNAAGSPQAIALSGTGVISGPNITLSVTSLTFATQLVGSTSTAQSVTLSNYGTVTLSITSIGFTGADPGDFHQTNNCGSSITPGASCTISITFNPTQRGTRTANLDAFG